MVTPPSNQSAVEAAGQSFNLGSFSDGGSGSWTASVAWGDGTSMMLPAPSGPGSLGSSSHMYAEEGTYTVTVTVTDTGDQQSGTGMFQVTVSDPAVSASPSVGFNAMEGSAVSNQQLATFVDPAGAEALASYSASINWGDGTAATTGGISFSGSAFTITGSHTYAEEGSYTVTVTINHETSTTQTVTSTATVSDPAVAANGIGVNAVLSTSFTSAVATFTDPGSLEVLGDYSATINWGDSTPATTGTLALTNGIVTVSGSHAYTSTGSFTVTTTIHHDTATPTTVTSTAMVGNAPPPVVTAAGNQTATEAGSKSFTIGSFQDAGAGPDSGSINWGDGTTATSLGTVTPGTLSNQTHTYAEEGSYTVTITITDAGSSQSGTGMFVVTVSDPNVAATGGLSFTAQEGALSTTQSVATFTDPGIAEANDGTHYSASINWGDNTAATTGTISFANGVFAVSGNHSYAEEGTYTLTVTINHETSTTQTVTSTATVSDPAVMANGVGVNAIPNFSFTAPVATFTDPGTPEVLGDYSATINWGDNTPATMGTIAINNGTFTVSGSHAYASTGSFTVTTTIHHDTASPTTVMSTAMIANATFPVVTAAGNQTATEGGSQSLTIGSFQDSGAGPDSGSINWGDGTTATSLGTVTPGTLSNQTHTYAEEGSYTVTITITDAGSSQSGTGMFVVTVSDPNVTATGGVSVTAQEGAPSTSQAVATFTDPGIAEANDGTHYSASINWGDNTAATAGSISFSGTTFTVSGSHAYAEEGSYTLTVTINHENSAAQTVTSTATVSNANVAASGGLSFNGTEGTGLGTQTVATFTDPGGAEPIADYSATINWGDGTTATAGTITVTGTTFSITGSHSYGEEGTYTLSVTVNHETSTSQTITDTATISDVAVAATGVPVNAGVNSSSTVSVATFTDPGGTEPADGTHYSASITWGDNTPASVGTITLTNGVYTVMG